MPGSVTVHVYGDTSPLRKELKRLSRVPVDINFGGAPLGRIKGDLGEFEKSLAASNARVLAFGASAGIIMGVQQAFTEMVRSAVEVEKSLVEINTVLNTSHAELQRFGNGLFDVAKNTAQSFDTVAEAALEFARQGIGMEETLKRTNDALILTRISGLDAAASVNAITAALNGFASAALNSTEVVSKMAKVDQAFAVSSGDLAEAIRRVGSTAESAGVSFDQLLAVVTATQQVTARGGNVIGNAFKTIFTRIQRPKVLDSLEAIGVATKDAGGAVRPLMSILTDLAKTYDTLAQSQQAQIAELVGGVFQINILKAAMSDLSKEFSIYGSALDMSKNATNDAIARNESLNQSFSALINKTFANLKKGGAQLGENTLGPAIGRVLKGINSVLESAELGDAGETLGGKLTAGISKGMGDFLAGPGLMVGMMALFKLFDKLRIYATDAFKSISGGGKVMQRQAAVQGSINQLLSREPSLLKEILNGTKSLKDAHDILLRNIKAENREMRAQVDIVKMLGKSLSTEVDVTASGVIVHSPAPAAHRGHVPNFFYDPFREEEKNARALGAASGVKAHLSKGTVKGKRVIMHDQEEEITPQEMKKRYGVRPKGQDSAIIPLTYKPEVKEELEKRIARIQEGKTNSMGFVPNFGRKSLDTLGSESKKNKLDLIKRSFGKVSDTGVIDASDIASMIIPTKANTFGVGEYRLKGQDVKLQVKFPIKGAKKAPDSSKAEKSIKQQMVGIVKDYARASFVAPASTSSINKYVDRQVATGSALSQGVGRVFESSVEALVSTDDDFVKDARARWDFAAGRDGGYSNLGRIFGVKTPLTDAKATTAPTNLNSMAEKFFEATEVGKRIIGTMNSFRSQMDKGGVSKSTQSLIVNELKDAELVGGNRKKAIKIAASYLRGTPMNAGETPESMAEELVDNNEFKKLHQDRRKRWIAAQKESNKKMGRFEGNIPNFNALVGYPEDEVPNFLPFGQKLKRGRNLVFEDFDENLVTYPADMDRGELFNAKSVRKSTLTQRGKDKVDYHHPIAILTARNSAARKEIELKMQENNIPVDKVITTANMFNDLKISNDGRGRVVRNPSRKGRMQGYRNLKAAEKKALLLQRIQQKHGGEYTLWDDSPENIQKIKALGNPKIMGRLTKETPFAGRHSGNWGGNVPNFATGGWHGIARMERYDGRTRPDVKKGTKGPLGENLTFNNPLVKRLIKQNRAKGLEINQAVQAAAREIKLSKQGFLPIREQKRISDGLESGLLNLNEGHVPNFAKYNSREEVRRALLLGGKSASYIRMDNPFVRGDPQMEALVRSVKTKNAQRAADKKDAAQARAAAKFSGERLDVLYMENIDEAIDRPGQAGPASLGVTGGHQQDIRKFGFSSKTMPGIRQNFDKSFAKHWPGFTGSVATDLLKGQKFKGEDLRSKWNPQELSQGAKRSMQGLLFEEFVKGMSKRMTKKPETGKEAVDLQDWEIREEFGELFTPGMPRTDVEVKRTYLKSKEARGKMEDYEKEKGKKYRSRYRKRFLGEVPNFLIPTSNYYVPNFYGDELEKSKEREIKGLRDRGYSLKDAKASVRVGRDKRITANDDHMLVYNIIDEPRGAGQGVDLAISRGRNIQSHGMTFTGNIPNFAEEDGFIKRFLTKFEAALHSGEGAAGAVGAAVEGAGAAGLGMGITPQALKELNTEGAHLQKQLQKSAKATEDRRTAMVAAGRDREKLRQLQQEQVAADREELGVLGQLNQVDEERIRILGSEADVLNQANRLDEGGGAFTGSAGTPGSGRGRRGSVAGAGTAMTAATSGLAPEDVGRGVGGIEAGRKEKLADAASSDLLQKSFYISSSLGIIEQLAPELSGLTNTVSGMTNTFASIASVIPGTAGKVIGGLAALAVGLEAAKTAVVDWMTDFKGVQKRAQENQAAFSKLNDSLSQFSSVFDQLVNAAKDAGTPFELLDRLNDKIANLLANMPEEFADRLAEATTSEEVKEISENIRSAENLKNARSQLAAKLMELNKTAESGVLSFFKGGNMDNMFRSGGFLGNQQNAADERRVGQWGRDVMGSLDRALPGGGRGTIRDAIVSGEVTEATFQGTGEEVTEKLAALGFDPEDLARAFQMDANAFDDLSTSMQKNVKTIRDTTAANEIRAQKIKDNLKIEKEAAKTANEAAAAWRKASQEFSKAVRFQVDMQNIEHQSKRRITLAAGGNVAKLTAKTTGLRGQDLGFALKRQEIRNEALTKVEDTGTKTRSGQLGNIYKEIFEAEGKAKGSSTKKNLMRMRDEISKFEKTKGGLDSAEYTKQMTALLEKLGQMGDLGDLDIGDLKTDLNARFQDLIRANTKTMQKLDEQLKIAENNWKTNREIAKRANDSRTMGGIGAYFDPSKLEKPLENLMDQLQGLDTAREKGFGGQETRAGAGITAALMELGGGAAVQMTGVDLSTQQVADPTAPGGVREESSVEKQERIQRQMAANPGFAAMRSSTIDDMAQGIRDRFNQIAKLMAQRFGENDFRTRFAREQAGRSGEIATLQFDEKFLSEQIPQKQLDELKKIEALLRTNLASGDAGLAGGQTAADRENATNTAQAAAQAAAAASAAAVQAQEDLKKDREKDTVEGSKEKLVEAKRDQQRNLSAVAGTREMRQALSGMNQGQRRQVTKKLYEAGFDPQNMDQDVGQIVGGLGLSGGNARRLTRTLRAGRKDPAGAFGQAIKKPQRDPARIRRLGERVTVNEKIVAKEAELEILYTKPPSIANGQKIQVKLDEINALKKQRSQIKATGHIPLSPAVTEVSGALNAGYTAGKVLTMNMPGMGEVTYNSAETVRQVPGFDQPFINPPEFSRAGKDHRVRSIKQTGIDPYKDGRNFYEGFTPSVFRQMSPKQKRQIEKFYGRLSGGESMIRNWGGADMSGRMQTGMSDKPYEGGFMDMMRGGGRRKRFTTKGVYDQGGKELVGQEDIDLADMYGPANAPLPGMMGLMAIRMTAQMGTLPGFKNMDTPEIILKKFLQARVASSGRMGNIGALGSLGGMLPSSLGEYYTQMRGGTASTDFSDQVKNLPEYEFIKVLQDRLKGASGGMDRFNEILAETYARWNAGELRGPHPGGAEGKPWQMLMESTRARGGPTARLRRSASRADLGAYKARMQRFNVPMERTWIPHGLTGDLRHLNGWPQTEADLKRWHININEWAIDGGSEMKNRWTPDGHGWYHERTGSSGDNWHTPKRAAGGGWESHSGVFRGADDGLFHPVRMLDTAGNLIPERGTRAASDLPRLPAAVPRTAGAPAPAMPATARPPTTRGGSASAYDFWTPALPATAIEPTDNRGATAKRPVTAAPAAAAGPETKPWPEWPATARGPADNRGATAKRPVTVAPAAAPVAWKPGDPWTKPSPSTAKRPSTAPAAAPAPIDGTKPTTTAAKPVAGPGGLPPRQSFNRDSHMPASVAEAPKPPPMRLPPRQSFNTGQRPRDVARGGGPQPTPAKPPQSALTELIEINRAIDLELGLKPGEDIRNVRQGNRGIGFVVEDRARFAKNWERNMLWEAHQRGAQTDVERIKEDAKNLGKRGRPFRETFVASSRGAPPVWLGGGPAGTVDTPFSGVHRGGEQSFEYKGAYTKTMGGNQIGDPAQGVIRAQSQAEAIERLRQMGVGMTDLNNVNVNKSWSAGRGGGLWQRLGLGSFGVDVGTSEGFFQKTAQKTAIYQAMMERQKDPTRRLTDAEFKMQFKQYTTKGSGQFIRFLAGQPMAEGTRAVMSVAEDGSTVIKHAGDSASSSRNVGLMLHEVDHAIDFHQGRTKERGRGGAGAQLSGETRAATGDADPRYALDIQESGGIRKIDHSETAVARRMADMKTRVEAYRADVGETSGRLNPVEISQDVVRNTLYGSEMARVNEHARLTEEFELGRMRSGMGGDSKTTIRMKDGSVAHLLIDSDGRVRFNPTEAHSASTVKQLGFNVETGADGRTRIDTVDSETFIKNNLNNLAIDTATDDHRMLYDMERSAYQQEQANRGQGKWGRGLAFAKMTLGMGGTHDFEGIRLYRGGAAYEEAQSRFLSDSETGVGKTRGIQSFDERVAGLSSDAEGTAKRASAEDGVMTKMRMMNDMVQDSKSMAVKREGTSVNKYLRTEANAHFDEQHKKIQDKLNAGERVPSSEIKKLQRLFDDSMATLSKKDRVKLIKNLNKSGGVEGGRGMVNELKKVLMSNVDSDLHAKLRAGAPEGSALHKAMVEIEAGRQLTMKNDDGTTRLATEAEVKTYIQESYNKMLADPEFMLKEYDAMMLKQRVNGGRWGSFKSEARAQGGTVGLMLGGAALTSFAGGALERWAEDQDIEWLANVGRGVKHHGGIGVAGLIGGAGAWKSSRAAMSVGDDFFRAQLQAEAQAASRGAGKTLLGAAPGSFVKGWRGGLAGGMSEKAMAKYASRFGGQGFGFRARMAGDWLGKGVGNMRSGLGFKGAGAGAGRVSKYWKNAQKLVSGGYFGMGRGAAAASAGGIDDAAIQAAKRGAGRGAFFKGGALIAATIGGNIVAHKAISAAYQPQMDALSKAYAGDENIPGSGDPMAGIKMMDTSRAMKKDMMAARMGIDMAALAATVWMIGAAGAPETMGGSLAVAALITAGLMAADVASTDIYQKHDYASAAGMRLELMRNYGVEDFDERKRLHEAMAGSLYAREGNAWDMDLMGDMAGKNITADRMQSSQEAIRTLMSGETGAGAASIVDIRDAALKATSQTQSEREAVAYTINRDNEGKRHGWRSGFGVADVAGAFIGGIGERVGLVDDASTWDPTGAGARFKSRVTSLSFIDEEQIQNIGEHSRQTLENRDLVMRTHGLNFENLKVDEDGKIKWTGSDYGERHPLLHDGRKGTDESLGFSQKGLEKLKLSTGADMDALSAIQGWETMDSLSQRRKASAMHLGQTRGELDSRLTEAMNSGPTALWRGGITGKGDMSKGSQKKWEQALGADTKSRQEFQTHLESNKYYKGMNMLKDAKSPEAKQAAFAELKGRGMSPDLVRTLHEEMYGRGTKQGIQDKMRLENVEMARGLVNSKTGKQVPQDVRTYLDPVSGERYYYKGNKKHVAVSRASYINLLALSGQLTVTSRTDTDEHGAEKQIQTWKLGNDEIGQLDYENEEEVMKAVMDKLFTKGSEVSHKEKKTTLSQAQQFRQRKAHHGGYGGQMRGGLLNASKELFDRGKNDARLRKLQMQMQQAGGMRAPKAQRHKREFNRQQGQRWMADLEALGKTARDANTPDERKRARSILANRAMEINAQARFNDIRVGGELFSTGNVDMQGRILFGDLQYNSETSDIINTQLHAAMTSKFKDPKGMDVSNLSLMTGMARGEAIGWMRDRMMSGDLFAEEKDAYAAILSGMTDKSVQKLGMASVSIKTIEDQRVNTESYMRRTYGADWKDKGHQHKEVKTANTYLRGLKKQLSTAKQNQLGALQQSMISSEASGMGLSSKIKVPMAGAPGGEASLGTKYKIPASLMGQDSKWAIVHAMGIENLTAEKTRLEGVIASGGGAVTGRDQVTLNRINRDLVARNKNLDAIKTRHSQQRDYLAGNDPDKLMAMDALGMAGADALPEHIRGDAMLINMTPTSRSPSAGVVAARERLRTYVGEQSLGKLRERMAASQTRGGRGIDSEHTLVRALGQFAGDKYGNPTIRGGIDTIAGIQTKQDGLGILLAQFEKTGGLSAKTFVEEIIGQSRGGSDTRRDTMDSNLKFGEHGQNLGFRRSFVDDMSMLLAREAQRKINYNRLPAEQRDRDGDGTPDPYKKKTSAELEKEFNEIRVQREERRQRKFHRREGGLQYTAMAGLGLSDPSKPLHRAGMEAMVFAQDVRGVGGAPTTQMMVAAGGSYIIPGGTYGPGTSGATSYTFDPQTGNYLTKQVGSEKKGSIPQAEFLRLAETYAWSDKANALYRKYRDLKGKIGASSADHVGSLTEEDVAYLASILSMREQVLAEKTRNIRMRNVQSHNFGGFVPNFAAKRKRNYYRGFVPDFSRELNEAKTREVQALVDRGYDQSTAQRSIYVADHPAITSNNARASEIKDVPNFGIGVFNRIDEPFGAGQGINRARQEGQSINTYGTKASIPAFHATPQMRGAFVGVPNFAEAQQKMNNAAEAFGDMAKAAESISSSINNTDEVKQIQSISSEETSNANVNVNVRGSIEAVPNAVAKAVIDWSKKNIIKGGGYFPPHRRS